MLTTASHPDMRAVIHWSMWSHWDRGTPGPVLLRPDGQPKRDRRGRIRRGRRKIGIATPESRERLEAYGQCPPGFASNPGVRVSDTYWLCLCPRRDVPAILHNLADADEIYGFRGTPVRNLNQYYRDSRDAALVSEVMWLRAQGVPIDAPGHDQWVRRWEEQVDDFARQWSVFMDDVVPEAMDTTRSLRELLGMDADRIFGMDDGE